MADTIRHLKKSFGYWEKKGSDPSWKSWSGYSFEAVCYKHISQIREALNISVTARIGTWHYFQRKGDNEKGAQIDLLFDRDDNVTTLCEIKYNETPFEVNKLYANNLINKMHVYKKQTKSKKQLFLAMIASGGLKPTMYSEELIASQVTLEDLFQTT